MKRIILTHAINSKVVGDTGVFAPRLAGAVTPAEAAAILHEDRGEVVRFGFCGLAERGATYHAFEAGKEVPLLEVGRTIAEQLPVHSHTPYCGSVRQLGARPSNSRDGEAGG